MYADGIRINGIISWYGRKLFWSLEAYPDLITGIKPEDRSQIQEFVEKKLLDFAQRDHITEPFKVKIVKDQEVISRRKRIINGLISEITLEIPTKLWDSFLSNS